MLLLAVPHHVAIVAGAAGSGSIQKCSSALVFAASSVLAVLDLACHKLTAMPRHRA